MSKTLAKRFGELLSKQEATEKAELQECEECEFAHFP